MSETNFEQKMSSLLFFSCVTEMSNNFDFTSVSVSITLEKKKTTAVELVKM